MKGLVFVLGPTAVGKSQFATTLAEINRGFILNCDSVQSFAHVNIGAAKPNAETRARVPHLLLDWVNPGEEFNASLFHDEAVGALAKALPKGPVFAVGGSGFYVRALCRGTFNVKTVPQDRAQYWRSRVEVEGSLELHKLLAEKDPTYSAKVSPQDAYRITRALGLMEVEGRTVTAIQKEHSSKPDLLPYPYLKIGFERRRDDLLEKITARCEQMLQSGWREEVERLLAQGLRDWQPLKSVGYKEMVQAIDGQLEWSDLPQAIVNSTMRLAKKQMTWFRADPEIQWFKADIEEGRASEMIQEFLLGN